MEGCRPKVILNKAKPSCKISVILLDWGVRESFHSLEYLNQQTADRDSYELIWLEFYENKPEALCKMVEQGIDGRPALDQWIVAGYPEDVIFNKHRLYNLGILAAKGEICVICDSDAIFTPHFIDRIIQEFDARKNMVLHLDEIRNSDPCFYPFRYPEIDEIVGEGCYNWHGTVSRGLDNSPDMLHHANYGACMAARRTDLIAIGGSDEHLDYLGYVCGPYEMTFRLINHGLEERWLRDEYLYHTWHPNENGVNTDYHGPHDGRMMSLRAMETRLSGRAFPGVENPWIAQAREGKWPELHEILGELADRVEANWQVDNAPRAWDGAYMMERDFHGFNLFLHDGKWFALPTSEEDFDPKQMRNYPTLLQEQSEPRLRDIVRHYSELPKGFWPRVFALPLYRLPYRVVRRVARELARLR